MELVALTSIWGFASVNHSSAVKSGAKDKWLSNQENLNEEDGW